MNKIKKIRKRHGAAEFVYLIILIAVSTIIISGFYTYYRNIVQLNSTTKELKNNTIIRSNINTEIARIIQDKDSALVENVEGYDVKVSKLTNNIKNDQNEVIKTIKKNYAMTSVKVFNNTDEFVLNKQKDKNYFLFSNSTDGISVGYTSNKEDYTVGNINDTFYYGLERAKSLNTNPTLFIKPKTKESKLVYIEFDNNNIPEYDFFVAKVEKEDEIYYTIYMETYSSIIEIYSFTN